MKKIKIRQCGACSNRARPSSVLCIQHSLLYAQGIRIQCDGFAVEKKIKTHRLKS